MTELTAFASREDAMLARIAATPPAPWLPQLEHGPDETLLRHYLRVFYRNRWIISAITGACLAVAIVVSMLIQRQYAAVVRIQIAREAAKVVDVEDLQADQGEITNGTEFYQTQYALLRSRSLSEA